MNAKKLFSVMLIVLTLIATSVSSINAYGLQNYGWKSTSIPIKYDLNSEYRPIIEASIKAWNNVHPKIKIYYSSKASNVIYIGEYKESWVGYYSYYLNKKKQVTRFNIYINDRLVKSKTNNYKQSVLVHELGHALSLADNPGNTKGTIMSYSRNRNKMITPQADDIAGVKKTYNLK